VARIFSDESNPKVKKPIEFQFENRFENEGGQRTTADCNGEGTNDLVEMTTLGGSPASILLIQSLHHAAAGTPAYAVLGTVRKSSTFIQRFTCP